MRLIPHDHWKWCGLEPKKKKKQPEIQSGDLTLYDRHGNLMVHKGNNNVIKEKSKKV